MTLDLSHTMGWGGGLAVKSTFIVQFSAPSRDKLPVIPTPEDWMPSSGLLTHVAHLYTCSTHTYTYI